MVLRPLFLHSTTLCVCLLLLQCHFCHSCHVFFCCMSCVHAYPPQYKRCIISSYFPMGLDGVLAEVLAYPTHWSSTPIVFFSCLVCSLLVIISAMLAHWAYYLFPWASLIHLLYFYLLLCLWAYWLSFLPCWPIELMTSSLGLPLPICFTFTSCCAYGLASCHSCHVGPLGLLPPPLSLLSPFVLLLPIVLPMGLMAVILAMLAHWVYYLLPWTSLAHLLYFYLLLFLWVYWLSFMSCWPFRLITSFLGLSRPIYFTFTSFISFFFHLSSLLGFFYCCTFFVKNGHQHLATEKPWLNTRIFNW